MLTDFFRTHPNIGGAVVFNTCAYIISDFMKRNNIKNVKLIGFDINTRNVNALKEGYISHLIAERPEYQGYMAIKAILEYLIYNKKPEVYNYTPIDIIINETVDFILLQILHSHYKKDVIRSGSAYSFRLRLIQRTSVRKVFGGKI